MPDNLYRLDLQFFQMLQASQSPLVDPIIPHDTPGLKIADVCCGTGYVLNTAASDNVSCLSFFLVNIRTDPSTELHAFDIDLSKLPPEAFLPNVKRHIWNINDPAPTDLASTFDIVNCQLLWSFVPDVNIDKVFSNILSLLKPGGYLQWVESIMIDEQYFSPDPSYEVHYLRQMFQVTFVEMYGFPKPTWPRDLDNVFLRNGVTVLKTLRSDVEPRNYKSWTMQQCSVFEEVKPFFRATINSEERRKQVEACEDLLEKCVWEAQVKNCAAVLPFIRVVGRKEA